MAIYRLLQNSTFNPEDVERMTCAYEECLQRLQLTNRQDPITETLARRIIEVIQTGMKDPSRICDQAIENLTNPTG